MLNVHNLFDNGQEKPGPQQLQEDQNVAGKPKGAHKYDGVWSMNFGIIP